MRHHTGRTSRGCHRQLAGGSSRSFQNSQVLGITDPPSRIESFLTLLHFRCPGVPRPAEDESLQVDCRTLPPGSQRLSVLCVPSGDQRTRHTLQAPKSVPGHWSGTVRSKPKQELPEVARISRTGAGFGGHVPCLERRFQTPLAALTLTLRLSGSVLPRERGCLPCRVAWGWGRSPPRLPIPCPPLEEGEELWWSWS